MNQLPPLDDSELHSTLLNALQVAADEYDKIAAKRFRTADLMKSRPQGYPAEWEQMERRLAEQFAHQAADCRELATKLEDETVDG
jgi:hypothetical protein